MLLAERSKVMTDPMLFFQVLKREHLHRCEIPRDEHFESNVGGLYPCGEGAGYAGGITSAAMDGLPCSGSCSSGLCPC